MKRGVGKHNQRLRRRRFLALFLGLLLTATLLETGVRLRQSLKFGKSSSTLYEFTEVSPGLRGLVPGSRAGRIPINSQGFRSPELEPVRTPSRIRVAFLGGSTTFCSGIEQEARTWPALVVQRLAEQWPGLPMDYVNAGVPGYSSETSLRNLKARVAPWKPDVLVIYHATNDLARESRRIAQEQGVWQESAPSWLDTHSLAWSLIRKNLPRTSSPSSILNCPVLNCPVEDFVPGFEQSLGALLAEAKRVTPVVVVATFRHRVRSHLSPEEKREACRTSRLYLPFLTEDQLLDSFLAYNRAIRKVASAQPVLLVEGEEETPGDATHFLDSVHLTQRGCQLLAERIARELGAAPEWLQLVADKQSRLSDSD